MVTYHMRTGADANSTDAYLPKTTEEKAGCVSADNTAVPNDPEFVFASTIKLQAWQPYPTGGDGSAAIETKVPLYDTEATLSVPNVDTPAILFPTLTAQDVAVINISSATATVTTDTGGGDIFLISTTDAIVPDGDQIIAGLNGNDVAANFAGSAPVTTPGTYIHNITGLGGGIPTAPTAGWLAVVSDPANVANGLPYTFAGTAIGADHPNRIVVVAILAVATSGLITSVPTLNGIAMSLVVASASATSRIFSLATAGTALEGATTATLAIVNNSGVAGLRCVAHTYTAYPASPTPVDFDIDTTATTTIGVVEDVAVKQGGVAFYFSFGAVGSLVPTWSGPDAVVVGNNAAHEASNQVSGGHILITEADNTTRDFTLTVAGSGSKTSLLVSYGPPAAGTATGGVNYAHWVHRDAGNVQSFVVSDTFDTTPDIIAPVLTAPSAFGTGTTTAAASVVTDEGNGLISMVVTVSVTKPTAVQVIAGQDHLGAAALKAGTASATMAGAYPFAITGLTPGTYYCHWTQEDAAHNKAIVVSSASFTLTSGIATTNVTSVTYHGATYSFSTAVPVGYYADGMPFAVSSAPFSVTSVTPASVNVLSDAYFGKDTVPVSVPPTNYRANGLMINPYLRDAATLQGFDGLIGTYSDTGGPNQSTRTFYSDTVNFDPAVNGPIAVAIGEEKSLVKSIRVAGLTTPGPWVHFQDWSVLHIVNAVPAVGAFAPCASKTSKASNFTSAMRDKTALGAGFAPSAGMPTLAACNAVAPRGYFTRPFMPFFGHQGERLRPFFIEDFGISVSGYTGNYAPYWCDHFAAMLATGSSIADADLNVALAFGINLVELSRLGPYGGSGAGQHVGHKMFVQLVGHVFHAAVPGLMNECLAISGNPTGQSFWVTSALVGKSQYWPGNAALYFHSFYPEHVGLPWWSSEQTLDVDGVTVLSNEQYSSEIGTDYQLTSGKPCLPELMNIMLLKAGPSGWDGSQVIARAASSWGTSNWYAACIAYYDRYATFTQTGWGNGVNTYETRHLAYWNDRRVGVAAPKWVGPPDAFAPPFGGTTFVSAAAGGFTWNLTNAKGATQTVTAWDIEYSLDQLSWVDVTSASVTGTQTGLAITPHYVRHRRQSAAGWGPYSTNWGAYHTSTADPVNRPSTPRNVITPTGSPSAAAPVFTVNPKLWKRTYRVASAHKWVVADGTTLTTAEAGDTITCGTGYVTGHPAPTCTYQKVRNGTPVGSASTSPILSEEAADVGQPVSCKVTATNASGSVNVTTAQCSWRGLPVPGAAFVAKAFPAGEYLTRASIDGAVDGKALTICFKITLGAGTDGGTVTVFNIRSGPTTSHILVQRRTTNVFRFSFLNDANTEVFRKDTTVFNVASGELEVLFSYNSATPTGFLYINGTNSYGTPTTATLDGIMDMNASNFTGVGTTMVGSSLKFFYFDDAFLDLSNATIRGKFATPILLEANGAGPSGSAPALCFYSSTDGSEWEINRGTGGSFTLITP